MSGCLVKNQEFIKECFDKGFYFADKTGNVMSWKQPRKGTRKQPKLLKGGLTQGYKRVVLCGAEKRLSAFIHVIVYLYYNRQSFSSQFHINHIDGNKLNNRLDNLELLSFDQNAAHASSKNLYRNNSQHPRWANCRVDSHSICHDRLAGRTVTELAAHYNTSRATISRICRAGGVKYVRQFSFKPRNDKGRFVK